MDRSESPHKLLGQATADIWVAVAQTYAGSLWPPLPRSAYRA